MKKGIFTGVCLAMMIGLCACGAAKEETTEAPAETTTQLAVEATTAAAPEEETAKGGNIEGVVVKNADSKIYSQEEIDAAIAIIEEDFAANFDQCTLKEIGYAGDAALKDYQDYLDQYGGDEVIVLVSTFDVGESAGSLEPGSTYEDWNWILVRNDKGQWKHVDHGY